MCAHKSLDRLEAVVLVAMVRASFPASAHAQARRGTRPGTVTDQSGAALPGATVVIYANDNGGPSTPAGPARSWGYVNFDRTHIFVSSFVWSLPWYKNSNAGVLRGVLGGWQVSGILARQAGQPLDTTMSNAALNTPDPTQRPNQTGDAAIVNTMGPDKTYLQWFDTSVFTSPAVNAFGTMTRNMGDVRGPGFNNLDVSIVKQVGFGGSRSGEFRVDVWHLPNTVHRGSPNTTYLNSQLGRITSVCDERQMRVSFRFISSIL